MPRTKKRAVTKSRNAPKDATAADLIAQGNIGRFDSIYLFSIYECA